MPLIGEFYIESDCGRIRVHYRRSSVQMINLSEGTCRQIKDEINARIAEIDNQTIREDLERTMARNLRGSIFE